MAKVQIDLTNSYIRCCACGKGTDSGTFPSPCPFCGSKFDRVEYKREHEVKARNRRKKEIRVVRCETTTYGRTVFTLGDMELEKRIAVDYEWNRQAAAIARKALANAQKENIDMITALDHARKEFYLKRGIVVESVNPSTKGPEKTVPDSPEGSQE